MKRTQFHTWTIGTTGSGKTTTTVSWLDARPRGLKFFINTKRQPGWSKHFDYTIRRTKVSDIKTIYNNYSDYINKKFEIIIERKTRKKEFLKILDYILGRHENNYRLRTYILIDEIHNYQSAKGLPKQIEDLFVIGEGMGCVGNAVAQRPQQIHWTIRANCQSAIMHYVEEKDLSYMTDKQSAMLPGDIENWKFPSYFHHYRRHKKLTKWKGPMKLKVR